MAANQLKSPSVVLGYLGANFANDTTLGLNAAATWLGLQFVPSATKTLKKVKLFQSLKTGTPTAAGCTCDLFSDSVGKPNASTEGPISADSVPATGNWMQWTFAGTSSVVGGTPYWLVWKNGTATPASNFPTYSYQAANASLASLPFDMTGIAGNAQFYGWNKVHSVNSGTNWATSPGYGVTGLRVEYTDGTFEGMPVQTSLRPASGTTADRAFGKQEVGVRFSIPAGATFNVMRIGFPIIRVSTPGGLVFRLYQGSTLLATAPTVPANNVLTTTGDWYFGTLSAAQAIVSTNQPFRAVFGDATAGDTNAVGYNSQVNTWENDANSLALKPMNGTLQKTVIPDNTAVVPVDTATDVIPFALLLDTLGELTAPPGVSGSRIFGGF